MTAGATVTREELRESLRAALDGLDAAGVGWSLLRPGAALADPEGDVDVLVAPESLPPAVKALTRLGLVAMPRPRPDAHMVAFDEPSGTFVWLHLQAELRLAGASLPAAAVLESATGGGLPEPAPDWLLWILLLRALVDKGAVPERHRPSLQRLAQRWESGPAALEEIARRHGIEPAEAVAAAAEGDWDRLLRQAVAREEPVRRPDAILPLRRLRKLASLRGRRGFSVAVLGPDGAGKSSLVAALAATLPPPTRVQYMGLTGGAIPKADKLRIPGVVFAGHVAILWSRYLRSWYHRARGEIVIFDRYTLDGAVPSGRRLTAAGRLSRRLQRWSCPMPDLVLLLDASGATMHARAGAYTAAVLEEWRAAYADLEGKVAVLQKLDAERPAHQVLRDAQTRIWRRYRELHPADE